MLQLACHAPLRPGELFGAEWEALDLDEATFEVRANLVRHDGDTCCTTPRPTSAGRCRSPASVSTRYGDSVPRRRGASCGRYGVDS